MIVKKWVNNIKTDRPCIHNDGLLPAVLCGLELHDPRGETLLQPNSRRVVHVPRQSDIRQQAVKGGRYRRKFGVVPPYTFDGEHFNVHFVAWAEFVYENVVLHGSGSYQFVRLNIANRSQNINRGV